VGEEVLPGKYIMDNMKFISSKIVYALNLFGLETCLGLYNNIFIKDKEVSGCAVSRKYGGFLYHATLLLNTNLEKLKKALNPPKHYSEDPRYIKSNRSEVMNVYEIKFINEIELMEAIYREMTLFFNYV
jgi:lipoate-protein ligase A